MRRIIKLVLVISVSLVLCLMALSCKKIEKGERDRSERKSNVPPVNQAPLFMPSVPGQNF